MVENDSLAERLLKASRECALKRDYSDEELLGIVLREAGRDCFMGVGRIFLDEFSRWYGCTPERVVSVLRSSGLKWRFGTSENVVLISL